MWEGREADGNMGLESISRIHQPTLLVYESDSVFLEAHQELSDRLPASSSAILPGAGTLKHFTSLEHPELILSSTRTFLTQHRAARLDASYVASQT
jgi:hypothetical protein